MHTLTPVATRGWLMWELLFFFSLSGRLLTEADSIAHPLPPPGSPQPHYLTDTRTPTYTRKPPNPPSRTAAQCCRDRSESLNQRGGKKKRERRAPDSGNRSTLKLQTLSLRSKGQRNRASWDPRREERETRQGEKEDWHSRDWETNR